MDEQIDWRPLADRLWDGRRTIALTAVVAVAAAVVLTLVLGNLYRAFAVLAVTKPEASLRFDERFSAPDPNPAFPYRVNTLRTYAELAHTPALAQNVLDRLEGEVEGLPDAETLLDRVRVSARADGSLVVIEARSGTPESAVLIANTWAEVFGDQMADVFGGAGEDQAVTEALREAAEALAAAEEATAEFHETSALPALEVEVANLKSRQRLLLEATDRLASVERDLAALRSRPDTDAAPDLAERLAALTLQLNALTSGTGAPVDLDVPADGLDVAVGPVDLDALEVAVMTNRVALEQAVSEVPQELAARTAELARENNQLARLQRVEVLAEERYLTLARKADELQVARDTARPELRLAAPATPPTGPDLRPLLRHAITALALGLVAGAALVLVLPSVREDAGESAKDG